MASPVDLSSPSAALVLYVSPRSRLEAAADSVARHSLKAAQFELSHLRPVSEKQMRSMPRRLCQVLPPLSGPHRVGYCKAEEGIEIYTPTKSIGKKPLLELPVGHPLRSELSPAQKESLETHSVHGIEPVGKDIVVFSHGWGHNAAEYRPLLEEVASHGYTVIALTHPESAVPPSPMSQEEEALVAKQLLEMQAKRIDSAVEEFGTDGSRIFLAGHSMGGAASIRVDGAKIAGYINLDGGLTEVHPVEKPVLTVLADHLHKVDPENAEDRQWVEEYYKPVMMKNWTDFDLSSKNSRLEQIKEVGHEDFTVNPLLNWVAGDDTARAGLKAHREAAQIIVNFLQQHP